MVDAEQQLRAVIEERIEAVRRKDPAPLAARQAKGIVTFDVLPPLASRGTERVEEKTRAWFDAYSSDIGYEVRDLEVRADGALGFCSFVYRVTGTLKSGDQVEMWVRATLGLERQDGEWLIFHDHESVPFDPESGRALIDLEP